MLFYKRKFISNRNFSVQDFFFNDNIHTLFKKVNQLWLGMFVPAKQSLSRKADMLHSGGKFLTQSYLSVKIGVEWKCEAFSNSMNDYRNKYACISFSVNLSE